MLLQNSKLFKETLPAASVEPSDLCEAHGDVFDDLMEFFHFNGKDGTLLTYASARVAMRRHPCNILKSQHLSRSHNNNFLVFRLLAGLLYRARRGLDCRIVGWSQVPNELLGIRLSHSVIHRLDCDFKLAPANYVKVTHHFISSFLMLETIVDKAVRVGLVILFGLVKTVPADGCLMEDILGTNVFLPVEHPRHLLKVVLG